MTICRTAREVLALAIDAIEGIFYAVCDFDRVADEMWAETRRRCQCAQTCKHGLSLDELAVEIDELVPGGLAEVAQFDLCQDRADQDYGEYRMYWFDLAEKAFRIANAMK